MKIKATETFHDRTYVTIPGPLTKADFHALRAGKVVDIPDQTAEHLIECGHAEAVTPVKEKEKKKEAGHGTRSS